MTQAFVQCLEKMPQQVSNPVREGARVHRVNCRTELSTPFGSHIVRVCPLPTSWRNDTTDVGVEWCSKHGKCPKRRR